jgi:hypothetical protein
MQDFWLFLHVLSAIVAFGALFAGPTVSRSADGTGVGFAKVATYIQAPALAVLLATGVLQAYAMEPREVFKEAWISIAFTVWIAMAVVMFFLIKALKANTKAVQPLSGAMHLLLVVALWAMIWQPGAPG